MLAFLRDDDGQGLVEYALIIAVIAIAVIVAMIFMPDQISNIFSNIGNNLTYHYAGARRGVRGEASGRLRAWVMPSAPSTSPRPIACAASASGRSRSGRCAS